MVSTMSATYPVPVEEQAPTNAHQKVDLGVLLASMKGCYLPLGKAPMGQAGRARVCEEFATVCGFSPAFGPLVYNRALATVYGTKFFCGAVALPPIHIDFMLQAYWESEVAPHDAADRFFRLVCGPGSDGMGRAELRPFIQAIAERHASLTALSPSDLQSYVDTVVAVVFYKHSKHGVIRLSDLRDSGFVASLNAVGRLEESIENSEYFSFSRNQKIRTDFLSLCGDECGVGEIALRTYRREGDGGTAVGGVRAKRVIDAAPRPFPTTAEGSAQGRQTLDFEAWVWFFLCEEALTAGTCTEREIMYCFALMDQAGEGVMGLAQITPFYQDMIWERKYKEGRGDQLFPPVDEVISQYYDWMGVEQGRGYMRLPEMLTPENVQRAGHFFDELFYGTSFQEATCYTGDEDTDCDESSLTASSVDVETFVDSTGTTYYYYPSSPTNSEVECDVYGVGTECGQSSSTAKSFETNYSAKGACMTGYDQSSLAATCVAPSYGVKTPLATECQQVWHPEKCFPILPAHQPYPQANPTFACVTAPVWVNNACCSFPQPTPGFEWGMAPAWVPQESRTMTAPFCCPPQSGRGCKF